MQAIDQQVSTVTSPRFIRVMAGFGMIMAALLVVVAVAAGSHNATSANVASDSLAIAAFRAGERAALPQTAAQQSTLVNAFRAGERGYANVASSGSNAAFRAGERGDSIVTPSASSRNAAELNFRAGERGDPGAN